MSAGENRRCPLRCCARKRCGDDQWLMVPQLQAAAPPALLGRPAAECRPSKQPSSPSVPPSRRPWPPSPRSSVSSSISRTSATSPSAAPPPTTTASGSWRRRWGARRADVRAPRSGGGDGRAARAAAGRAGHASRGWRDGPRSVSRCTTASPTGGRFVEARAAACEGGTRTRCLSRRLRPSIAAYLAAWSSAARP
jgi:hypothetical protein